MTTTRNSLGTKSSGRKLVFVHVFDAPRELVFKLWTDPKHLPEWWGPKYLKTTIEKMDLRSGGAWRFVQQAPDGTVHAFRGVYREVQPPELLVQTFIYEPWPDQEVLVTVTFEDRHGKTKLTNTSLYPTVKSLQGYLKSGARDGMAESIERFTKLLRGIRELEPTPLVVEKTLSAPVARVWKAITNREEMAKWYFNLKEFKPQVGFEFGFDVEHKGATFRHRCKVTEVKARKKLAYTWRYAGHDGDSLVIFELFPHGARTRLRLTHAGLETFPGTAAFARKNFKRGWTMLIGESLKKFVEAKSTGK